MKTLLPIPVLMLPALLILPVSCDEIFGPSAGPDGELRIAFAEDLEPGTRSASMPDVNDFILTVTDREGNAVYEGTYGKAPVSMSLSPGPYTVSAVSCVFEDPRFDAPQYGDTQVAVVEPSSSVSVSLTCSQINAGVKLRFSPEFLDLYPNGVIFLKSPQGKLMYGYSETRTAYFNPGPVSLVLDNGVEQKVLMTRSVASREVLAVTLTASHGASPSSESSGTVSVSVDTTRQWICEDFDFGPGKGGSDISSAFSVSQAISHVGSKAVWVTGYIVGGDLTSSKCSFRGPFTSRTNIVIGPKENCTERQSCLSVQLSKGDIRDAVNLVDHEELLGKKIYLKGDIVGSYYGITGLQSVSAYSWGDD